MFRSYKDTYSIPNKTKMVIQFSKNSILTKVKETMKARFTPVFRASLGVRFISVFSSENGELLKTNLQFHIAYLNN